jgi:type IV secretion system protein VirD4
MAASNDLKLPPGTLILAQSSPAPAGLWNVPSTAQQLKNLSNDLNRSQGNPPATHPHQPAAPPPSSGFGAIFGGGLMSGYKPYDPDELNALDTPIRVAPGLDPHLPPPPRNHYPNLTWGLTPDGTGWKQVPFPLPGQGGGAYMYVDNIWQHVDNPKHYQYMRPGGHGPWLRTPDDRLDAKTKTSLMYQNHEGPAFDQFVYDHFPGRDAQVGVVQGHAREVLAMETVKIVAPVLGWLLLAVILFLVLRAIKRRKRRQEENERAWQEHQDTVHGTSRWATFNELVRDGLIGQDRGLIVGQWWLKQRHKIKKLVSVPHHIRFADDGHLLTFAPTGAGKGVSSIIPNLLTYRGSVVCIDPKGENAGRTAGRRVELGQTVLILDPFGRTKMPSINFNPIGWVDPNGPRAADDAAMIAECLMPAGDRGTDQFWNNEARALVAGLVLHVAYNEAPENKNLGSVRDLLNLSPTRWKELLKLMSESDNRHIAAAGNRAMQKADREASSVLSTAQSHTHFLDSDFIRKSLSGNAFPQEILKKEKVSLFLVLPAEELRTHARWLRLLVSMLLNALARTEGKPAEDVLFLLDEFAALGYLPAVETAMGLLRGYGVKLWPILQDLPQLQATYPKWQSFVANAGAVQFFGVNDKATAEYASSLMGQTTVRTGHVTTTNMGASENVGRTGRSLMMPDEIMRMNSEDELVKIRGRHPILCGRTIYYQEPFYNGMWYEWP